MAGGRQIIVAGGGIGGVEAALTLALGLPDDTVSLITRSDTISVQPDLVYVPFGLSARDIEIPVDRLTEFGVTILRDEVRRVDPPTRQVLTHAGPYIYDALVASPGAEPNAISETALRSDDDARRVRAQLAELVEQAEQGSRRSITIDVGAEDSWSAPAAEFSVLLGAWLTARGVSDRVEVLYATEDREPFEWFGPEANDIVSNALRRHNVKLATGIPSGHAQNLGGDLTISFGSLMPRNIDGLPGRSPDGWYVTDEQNRVADEIFVIGDATSLVYRSAFATAWESRRVLHALGGDHSVLGADVDGVPSDQVEYQMDLADSVLRARFFRGDALARPFLGHDADVTVHPGALPHKLAGLLLADRLLTDHDPDAGAPHAFRELLAGVATASA